MPAFMIEVPHEKETIACARAVKLLLETGSHFLTHAQFGCHDGVHKAWIMIDADSKEEAAMVLPTTYRGSAQITMLNKFSMEEIDSYLEHHD